MKADFERLHELICLAHRSDNNNLMIASSFSKLLKLKNQKRAYDTEEEVYGDIVQYFAAV